MQQPQEQPKEATANLGCLSPRYYEWKRTQPEPTTRTSPFAASFGRRGGEGYGNSEMGQSEEAKGEGTVYPSDRKSHKSGMKSRERS